MLRHGPVVAWVIDDTGFPKKGHESVGVARQYCGQVGKQDNCRVAVSLSVSTETASMPVAFRLYLPEVWIKDSRRRKKTGIPEQIQFQTKSEIALEQIQRARQRGIPEGVVLADAGYGNDTGFRMALTKMELTYVMGVQSSVTVWKPGEEPAPEPAYQGTGRPTKTPAARPRTPACLGQGTGPLAARRGLEEGELATGRAEETAVAVCRFAVASRASRLLASRTAS